MNRFTNRQVVVLCAVSMSVGAVLSPPSSSLAQPSEPGISSDAGAPQPLATPPASSGASLSLKGTRAIGTITGQGTTGNISKFTGTNAIGNSALFENGGKVGIGTTAPTGMFSATSSDGIALYGLHSSTSAGGDQPAVLGETLSPLAYAVGVRGTVKTASPGALSAGVRGLNTGTNANGFGVYGSHAGGGTGIYGTSNTGTGVLGDGNSGIGVRGRHTLTTGTAPGVSGETNSTADNANGVLGIINSTSPGASSTGVRGINNSTGGSGYGVYGSHAGSGYGVYGTTSTGIGVVGSTSNSSTGVFGNSFTGYGVFGNSYNSNGVYGYSNLGAGIYGNSESGYAGYFVGDVTITGKLTKGSGSFKIDHPLHPATEYLSHSFVESPDMMNIYNGNATTDANGRVTITMPSYFSALNREFRYTLTPIGAPAPNLYVAQEIRNNRWVIAGGKPGLKVSWQVTGVRNDAYARQNRIRVEETKTGADRGKYLYPAGFGAGKDKQIGGNPPRLAKR